MSHPNIIEATTDTFQTEVLQSDKPVLVDFWAEWCGPCRMVAPVLDEIAGENTDVRIVKVNVDDNQQLAFEYGVQSIPTFILFKGGEIAGRMMGAGPKATFENFIAQHAGDGAAIA